MDKETKTMKASGGAYIMGDDEKFQMSLKYRLLSEDQVHQWTGLPIATLRTMRSRPGRDPIPYTKLGRIVRYREDLLLKWLERNTFDCTDAQQEYKVA